MYLNTPYKISYDTQKFPFSMEKKANRTDVKINDLLYVIFNKGVYTFNVQTEVLFEVSCFAEAIVKRNHSKRLHDLGNEAIDF